MQLVIDALLLGFITAHDDDAILLLVGVLAGVLAGDLLDDAVRAVDELVDLALRKTGSRFSSWNSYRWEEQHAEPAPADSVKGERPPAAAGATLAPVPRRWR